MSGIMSGNYDKIYARYAQGKGEDGRETESRTAALEFYYTKQHLDGYITKDKSVLEVGCGTGYYGLYYADRCLKYVGIDFIPQHIEIFNKKITENTLVNTSCQVGDATNLESIPDNSFDVVLCLGPMYHLPPEERELVFTECTRVCKAGGITAFAYITSSARMPALVACTTRIPTPKQTSMYWKKARTTCAPDCSTTLCRRK
jgi:ubiquinone/menaquinone biosynthesis C-methylase UbiE